MKVVDIHSGCKESTRCTFSVEEKTFFQVFREAAFWKKSP